MAPLWRPALAAFCLAVLALLSLQVLTHGPLLELDLAITGWMVAHRVAWITAGLLFVTHLHSTVPVLAATALIAAWRGWRGDWPGVRALLVVPAAMLLNVTLKALFARARPVIDDPVVQLSTYSFPSGHAVAATAFYGMLCTLALLHARTQAQRSAAVALTALMVLLVIGSRVYLGAHFATDVIAGIAEGTLCVLLFQRFLHKP